MQLFEELCSRVVKHGLMLDQDSFGLESMKSISLVACVLYGHV